MILTTRAINLIKDKEFRPLLVEALGVTDQTIQDYIRKNKSNGPLTTHTCISVIKANSTLTEKEILMDPKKKPSPIRRKSIRAT